MYNASTFLISDDYQDAKSLEIEAERSDDGVWVRLTDPEARVTLYLSRADAQRLAEALANPLPEAA